VVIPTDALGHSNALDNPAGVPYLLTAAGAYAAVALVLLRRLPGLLHARLVPGLGLRPVGRGDALAAALGLVLVCALRLLTFVYLAAIGQPGHVQNGLGYFHATSALSALLTLLVGTTIAPFSEELLFRGTIYRAIASRMPDDRAAIASGLIFAAARLDLVLAPFFAAYGTLLAIAYRRTGNFFVPVAIRAAFDGLSYALLLWMDARAFIG